MGLKRKVNYNVDKLKLCYYQPSDLFAELARRDKGEYVDFGYFRLYVIDNGHKEGCDKPSVKAKANVVMNIEQSWVNIGTLTATNSAKYDGLCFLELYNSALYNRLGEVGERVNGLNCLPYIVTPMGLQLHNLTEIEIAAFASDAVVALFVVGTFRADARRDRSVVCGLVNISGTAAKNAVGHA